jgi:hypothetical protein
MVTQKSPTSRENFLRHRLGCSLGTAIGSVASSKRERYCPNGGMAFAPHHAAATKIGRKWRATGGSTSLRSDS